MHKKLLIVGAMAVTVSRFALGADMCAAAGEMAGKGENSFSGMVLETTNASRYTYVLVNSGAATNWVAGPAFEVKVGDRVSVDGGMLAKNFTSKTLGRKFDELYMAGSIKVAGNVMPTDGAMKLPAGHPEIPEKGTAASVMEPIQKPVGGKTVSEIWSGKSGLAGQTVVLRAKVVKVTKNVLKMNWLHLRDGTGIEGENDLVVTTKAEVRVGDVITVSGTLNTDKDFGSGYKYEVILEDAAVVGK